MATLANTAEGGTAAATVTVANSGAGSGNAWDALTIGSGGGITYDTTHAYGSLSYKFVSAATTTFVAWTSASVGTQATLYCRCYLYLTANPAAELAVARLRLGTTQTIRLGITTAGKLILRNTANSQVGLQTNSVALNAWARIEFKVTASSTVGVFEVKLFNSPDSTTATETTSLTSQVLTDNLDAVNFGPVGTTSGVTFWMDYLATSTVGYLGPASQSSAPSDTVTAGDALTRATTAARTVSDTTSAGDTTTRAAAKARTSTDASTLSDATTRSAATPRSLSDSLTVGDTLTRLVTASRTPPDTLAAADSPTRAASSSRATVDSAAASDALTQALAAARAVADSTALSDSLGQSSSASRLTADAVSATDTAARIVALARSFSDVLTATDAVSKGVGTTRATLDTLDASGAVSRALTLSRRPVDSVITTETLSRLLAMQRAVSDSVTLADTASVPVDITVTVGTPRRGWATSMPVRVWSVRDPVRVWSAGEPHT